MTNLEQIIRLGVSAEAATVYECVAALCDCPSPSKRLELIADLERAYRRCEDEYRRVDGLVEEFMGSDGEPAVMKHGRVVPSRVKELKP